MLPFESWKLRAAVTLKLLFGLTGDQYFFLNSACRRLGKAALRETFEKLPKAETPDAPRRWWQRRPGGSADVRPPAPSELSPAAPIKKPLPTPLRRLKSRRR